MNVSAAGVLGSENYCLLCLFNYWIHWIKHFRSYKLNMCLVCNFCATKKQNYNNGNCCKTGFPEHSPVCYCLDNHVLPPQTMPLVKVEAVFKMIWWSLGVYKESTYRRFTYSCPCILNWDIILKWHSYEWAEVKQILTSSGFNSQPHISLEQGSSILIFNM